MKPNREKTLWIFAAVLLAAGLAWTAYNYMQAGAFFAKMQGRQDAIAKLQALKQQKERIDSALAILASVTNAVRPLATEGAGAPAEIRALDTQPLGQGLCAKRTEVKFRALKLDALPEYLHSAESQLPPWRLAECVIESSPEADGIGSVRLTMEVVTRQP